MADRKNLSSDIGWATPDAIFVRGHDLCRDLMGRTTFGEMMFLQLMDRLPNTAEARMFDALAITLMEHGITPSALATRLTLAGAPESMQAAIAAGIAGLGSVFVGSTEAAARLLQEALAGNGVSDIAALARDRVRVELAAGRRVPGLGHHFHKPVDPRSVRLFAIAQETGFSGRHVALMQGLSIEAEAITGTKLPVNATGAVAAVASEIGLHWSVVPALGIIARTVGLIAHVREERLNPMAREIKTRVEQEVGVQRRAKMDKNKSAL